MALAQLYSIYGVEGDPSGLTDAIEGHKDLAIDILRASGISIDDDADAQTIVQEAFAADYDGGAGSGEDDDDEEDDDEDDDGAKEGTSPIGEEESKQPADGDGDDDDDDDDDSDEDPAEYRPALRPPLRDLLRTIQRTSGFYTGAPGSGRLPANLAVQAGFARSGLGGLRPVASVHLGQKGFSSMSGSMGL